MDDPDHERFNSTLPSKSATQPRYVSIAIDVGSSSIRCTAYDCGTTDIRDESSSSFQHPSYTVVSSSSKIRKSIDFYTGNIRIFDDEDTTAPSTNDIFGCIDTCLDEVLKQLQSQMNSFPPLQYQIIGVGFSTFVMNLIGIDHNYQPIGNTATMSYACQKKEVIDEIKQLQREINPQVLDHLYTMTGVPLHTAYALAQLRVWYRTNKKSNISNILVYQWSSIASICLHRWCGMGSDFATTASKSIPISLSEASWMGLLNIHSCQYERQIMNLLPFDCITALPSIATYDDENFPSFTLNTVYTTRWPLLNEVKFFLGVGDGACANSGSKCTSMNRIACTIGTSAAARVCIYYPIQQPPPTEQQCHVEQEYNEKGTSIGDDGSGGRLRIPSGLFCYRIDRYHVLIGGALTDGGNVVEWIQNHLMSIQVNTVEAMSAKTTPSPTEFELAMHDAERLLNNDYNEYCNLSNDEKSNIPTPTTPSLMVIPFFSGERNTGYRSNATGAMIGLTLQTKSQHIIKACLEGITLRLHAIIRLICDTVNLLIQHLQNSDHSSIRHLDEVSMMILCSGKALEKNQLWRSMIADCTGIPVYMETITNEGTSRGVVILMHQAMLQKQQESSTLTGRFITEDIGIDSDISPATLSDTKSLVTIQQPNNAVKGYWTALFEKQETMIEALAATSYWS